MTYRLLIGILIGGAIGALMGHFGKCSSGGCPLTANPFRGAIYGAVMGALLALSSGSARSAKTQQNPSVPPGEGAMHISSPEALNGYIDSETPCLIDFYSDRCPPCRRLGPTIDQLAAAYKGRAAVCKVNVVTSPQLAGSHRIRSIPAVLFFKNGTEVERRIGLQPREAYEQILNRMTEQPKQTR